MHKPCPRGRSAALAGFCLAAIACSPGLAAEAGGEAVKSCDGAGFWFPAEPEVLTKVCDRFMEGAMELPQRPIALIAPHAGYRYCAHVQARAYGTLRGHTYKRVVLIGFSHRDLVKRASVLNVDAYETPLGRIPVDVEARDALLKLDAVTEQPEAHGREHSVENQLPFLQRAVKDFRMVELLVGHLTPADRAALAEAIRSLRTEETLLVASTDFCHYGPNYGYVPFKEKVPQHLAGMNAVAVQEVLQVDVRGWDKFLAETRNTICGREAVGLLLKVLEPIEDAQGLRVGFDMSGRLAGDYTNSVTYASIVFWRAGEGLTPAEQGTLLRVARDAVGAFVKTGEPPKLDAGDYPLTPALKAPGAAFVTLNNGDRLRGCIGHLMPIRPLVVSVVENACSACRDPRFRDQPITQEELAELAIDISVLSPMRRLTDPQKVRVGVDGLVISRGRQRGLLLPQVPVEQHWSREEFLQGTCRKAGLEADAWKDAETEIYRFSAQMFSQEAPGPAAGEPAPSETAEAGT